MKEYLNASFDFDSKDIVNTYDELPLWAAPFGLKLLEKFDYKHNLNVLDIGCGVGFPLLELAQRLGTSSTVYGLDVWKAALEHIEYKAQMYGVKNIKCINGDANNIPFQSEFFDLIVSNNGINNTGNEQKTINECFRVCKLGGKFIFTVNLPETMIEFYNIFRQVLEQNDLGERVILLNEHINKYRKSVEQFKNFITNAGFRINDIDLDKFHMRFCNGTAMLNYHFIKMCFLQPWKDVVGKEKIVEIFDCLEDKLNDYAKLNNRLCLSIPYVCITCEKQS
jgi:arsenite methyltransferase